MKHLHYSWLVVIAGACVMAAYALVIYTFGIFLIPLTTEFGWERGALSGAYSLKMFLGGTLAILAGRMSDKYGPRFLVTTGGLLMGIGFLLMSRVSSLWHVYIVWGVIFGIVGACCFVPVMSTIPRWFTKRRGVAVGVTVAGFGLGAMISAPLTQWLIFSFGWQQAFVVLGIVSFIMIIPLAQFMRHSPQRIGLKPYGEDETMENKQSVASVAEGLSFKQAIKTSRFWLFGLILVCFFFCLHVVIVHIAPYAVDIGIPAIIAASILSIIAGSSLIGRLSIGFVSDKVGVRPALAACLVMVTLALIWLLFAGEIWMLYLFAVVFGIVYGGLVPLEMLVPAKLLGLGSLGAIFGALMFLGTIGGAIGPPLAGTIFDVTGSYHLALLICVIIGGLAVILSLILLKVKGGVAVTN